MYLAIEFLFQQHLPISDQQQQRLRTTPAATHSPLQQHTQHGPPLLQPLALISPAPLGHAATPSDQHVRPVHGCHPVQLQRIRQQQQRSSNQSDQSISHDVNRPRCQCVTQAVSPTANPTRPRNKCKGIEEVGQGPQTTHARTASLHFYSCGLVYYIAQLFICFVTNSNLLFKF